MHELVHFFPGMYHAETFGREISAKVLASYRQMQRIRREQAHVNELPVARLSYLFQLVNKSPSSPTPQFKNSLFFRDPFHEDDFPPSAGLAAIELFRENILPAEFLRIWSEIEEAAQKGKDMPEIRAFQSECRNVFILDPKIKDGKVHGIALVKSYFFGTTRLWDVDSEFFCIDVFVPQSREFISISESSFKIVTSTK